MSAAGRAASAFELALRAALAAVYLYAAVGKIADPFDFARALHNYRLLSPGLIVPVALVLPVWEALAAIAVLAGRLYRGAVAAILAMSVVFAAAVASAVVRGLDLECGCFGASVRSRADLGHILLNLATAAASSWLLVRARGRGRVQPTWGALRALFDRSAATART